MADNTCSVTHYPHFYDEPATINSSFYFFCLFVCLFNTMTHSVDPFSIFESGSAYLYPPTSRALKVGILLHGEEERESRIKIEMHLNTSCY